jgi:glycosyltransferase involved in cell wall biosynthesis
MKYPEYNISVLATNSPSIKGKRFSAKPVYPKLRTPFNKLNSLIKNLKVNQYFSFFSITREIKRFKPDIIIVQRDLTFSAMLAGLLKKIPVVNIIRDGMSLCPKDIDTRGFKNCSSVLSRNECWKCIEKWRTLRILLGDKPKGFNRTLGSAFYTVYYKFKYFVTKFYLNLVNLTCINVVASPLMRDLVKKRIKNTRITLRKITPIDDSNICKKYDKINEFTLKKIENSSKRILFVIPRNEGGSKGYPFVKKLINQLPQNTLLIVVGTLIEELKNYKNVVNIGRIPTDNLYYLYEMVDLTIIPSIYTEAFGRVLLESIINNTTVIVSPQTGAKYLFKDKAYVKVLPLNTNMWAEEIKKILDNPIEISKEEIKIIEDKFSSYECVSDIINLLKKIIIS